MLAELVSQYVDQMFAGGRDAATYVAVFAGYQADLAPLVALATRVRASLTPVEPRAEFREELRTRLLVAARARKPAPSHDSLRLLPQPRREVLIGAAAVGSLVSAAAIFAVVRSRSHTAKRAA